MRLLCPLRIFYVEDGLIRGLRQAGAEVLTLDGLPVRRAQLAEAVESFRPDLVFTYAWWPRRLVPEDLAWLRTRYRLPHVYWACDDPTYHREISLPLAALADLVLTTTEELLPVYRRMGLRAAYLQHACNPELHRRVDPDGEERHDVVLVAANYSQVPSMAPTFRLPAMRLILEPLVAMGVDLMVYGGGWADAARPFHLPPRYAGPAIPYRRLANVYAAAKIVLGLQTECHWATQTSCRPFEVLGCRAFHLAPATRSMRNLFTPGKHLVLSGAAGETAALVRYYLDHDAERARIAAAGQLEVYRRHTHLHRAGEFLAAVQEVI